MGYFRAGFDVVGVDHRYIRNYPFTLLVADAIRVMDDLLDGRKMFGFRLTDFAAIHASPPCQFASITRFLHPSKHRPNLIPPIKQRLIRSGLPYVIENVPGAEPWMNVTAMLCGTMFDMTVRCRDGMIRELRRHRIFETTFPVHPLRCNHRLMAATVAGHGGNNEKSCGYNAIRRERSELMQVFWMNNLELSQAIPPKYTTYIGHQMLRHLESGGQQTTIVPEMARAAR